MDKRNDIEGTVVQKAGSVGLKGHNSLSFNQATMTRAVQHWFDTVIFVDGVSPTVDSIKVEKDGHLSDRFVIDVKDEA